jgi:predicted nucleic acid-binding protein
VRTYFIDTWAFIALANRRDAGHEVAHEVDEFLEDTGWTAVTSEWIIDETLTQLHALAGAAAVLPFLDDVDAQLKARRLMLLNVTRLRFEAAITQFRALAPKVPRISLTDCSTFALMTELSIRWAFTADKHFYAAGPRIGPLVSRVDDVLTFRAPIT